MEILSLKKLRVIVQTLLAVQKLGIRGLNKCLDCMYTFDLHKAASNVEVPVLIMASYHDRICPLLGAVRIEMDIKKNKRLVVLPDTHHLSVVENPGEVSRKILKFFEEMNM